MEIRICQTSLGPLLVTRALSFIQRPDFLPQNPKSTQIQRLQISGFDSPLSTLSLWHTHHHLLYHISLIRRSSLKLIIEKVPSSRFDLSPNPQILVLLHFNSCWFTFNYYFFLLICLEINSVTLMFHLVLIYICMRIYTSIYMFQPWKT